VRNFVPLVSMMHSHLRILFLGVVGFILSSAKSQTISMHEFLGTPSRVIFEDKKPLLSDHLIVLNKVYMLSPSSSWEVIRNFDDQIGQSHLRLQQVYNGRKVISGVCIIHSKNGEILSLNGHIIPESNIKGIQKIEKKQAIDKGIALFPSEEYYWEDDGMNGFLQDLHKNPDTTYYPTPILAYASKDFDLNQDQRLCYVLNLFSHEPLFGEKVFIDAETGELVANESQILDADVKGKAVTKYSDTQTMDTDSTGPGNYRLRETIHGKGIETYNMRKGRSYGAAVDFTDIDNFWNNANANQDEVAGDAHWGAAVTYDYFYNNFNRNSFDDNGTKIRSYVHYSSNYYNAFWSTACNCMTYGDGNSGNPFPLTCLDVIAHEIAHAVTTNTAGLIYRNESGQLNESFSDIFGNTVESIGKPNGWSWAIGEEISTSGTGFRNMANPNLKNHPKYYKGNRWYFGAGDNGGVHLNSGVQNYWYYLLAQGSSGTNEKGDAFTIDSLGFESAGKIAYRNLSVYLTNSSNYSEARTYSIASAVDLFGPCSKEVIMVTNAWWVCGVGDKYDSAQVVANFVTDTTACSPSHAFEFRNTSTNSSKDEWYFGDGDTSNARNPTHTYAGYGTYTVKLRTTSCFLNNQDSLTRTNYIKIDSTSDICNAVLMPRNGTDSVEKCFGFVYDNGGESNYIALVKSNLKVTAPNADSIRLKFHYLDYENNFDSVVLFGKNTSQAEKIGQYTGTATPNSGNWMTIVGNTFWLKHYSDPFVEGAGFKIEFESFHPTGKTNLGKDSTLCSGDSIILRPNHSGGSEISYYYTWSNGSHQDSLTIKSIKDTIIWVEALDLCTREISKDTINITLREPLNVDLGNDTTICVGNPVQLNAISSGGLSSAYSYDWNQGLSNVQSHTISPIITTQYQVILSDGCSYENDTASKMVYVKAPLTITMDKDSTLFCIGKTTLLNTEVSGGDSLNYSYSWTSSSNTDSFEFLNLTDTILVKVSLNDGCTLQAAEDSVLILTYPNLNYQKSADTLLCRGTSVNLDISPSGGQGSNYSVNWAHGKSGNIVETPTNKETYYFTVSDGCSPDVSDSIAIDLMDVLSISPLRDTTLCDGQTLTISATSLGGRNSSRRITWMPGNLNGNSQSFNLPNGSIITAIANDGCTIKNDTSNLTLSRLPALQASITVSPGTICLNESTELSLSQAGGKIANRQQYLNGTLNANTKVTVKPSTAGTSKYVILVDDGCSTPARDSVSVTINPLPTATLSQSLRDICENGQVSLNYTSPSAISSLWWRLSRTDSFRSSSAPETINAPKTGSYLLSASFTDPNGCKNTSTMPDSLIVHAKPIASFIADPNQTNILENNINFTNTSIGAINWVLLFGDGQSELNTNNSQHAYLDTGSYTATLITSSLPGCNDTARMAIRIDDVYRLFFPTGFTPNDDGLNDVFKLEGRGIQSVDLKIYDRWGSILFKTSDANASWDGRDKNGKLVPNGSYIVIITVLDVLGDSHFEKGVLQVMR